MTKSIVIVSKLIAILLILLCNGVSTIFIMYIGNISIHLLHVEFHWLLNLLFYIIIQMSYGLLIALVLYSKRWTSKEKELKPILRCVGWYTFVTIFVLLIYDHLFVFYQYTPPNP